MQAAIPGFGKGWCTRWGSCAAHIHWCCRCEHRLGVCGPFWLYLTHRILLGIQFSCSASVLVTPGCPSFRLLSPLILCWPSSSFRLSSPLILCWPSSSFLRLHPPTCFISCSHDVFQVFQNSCVQLIISVTLPLLGTFLPYSSFCHQPACMF